MSEQTITDVNRSDREGFVDLFGGVYEHSSWVAERAWSDRPFESIDDLHETMKRVVEAADRDRQLELLRAHPDLGEQTEMTDASVEEQASAGLDQLTPEQYEAFQRLNDRYQDSFGFPFIMAVRDESPDAIRAAMEERVEHARSEEFRTAIDEVHAIARLRLDEILEP
jgi:2-oxo-4-hydroxy-4-carboxy-5-ureidoimidazoline decarboxylase